MNKRKKIAVLISGGGTNMQSIIDAIARQEINGDIVIVISSSEKAYGITRAKNANIPCEVCSLSEYGTNAKRNEKIAELLLNYGVELVVLAGYLGIITDEILRYFDGKIINIHPSLLPKFGGRNYYGLKVHEAVIAAKESITGATVHFVDSGTDTGRIIRQETIAVDKDDTPETLQKKVLDNIEHKLLVAVIRDMCK